jgi:hypothetical protein
MIKTVDCEHEFTLFLRGISELTTPIVDAFFAACDDCTLGISCGVPEVSFTRAAPTMKDAILSAIADVRRVGMGIDVLRIDCSFLLTQAEIARKLGKSRQVVHQYIRGDCGPGGFPPPARQRPSGTPLWQWSDVAQWLCRNHMAPESLVRDAEAVDTINCVLDYTWKSKHDGALVREVRSAMAGKTA